MSNLAVHMIPTHGRPGDLELISSHSRKLVKVVYGGEPDVNHVKDVYNRLDPDGVFILRNWALSEQKDKIKEDPFGMGEYHADQWLNWIAKTNLGLDPKRIRLEGVNEYPIWVHGNQPLNDYYCAFADKLNGAGWLAIMGHLNVGWPANKGADTESDWSPYDGMIQRASFGGNWLGLHEYFGLTGPEGRMQGWWAFRYKHMLNYCKGHGYPHPPIVITELGICLDWQDGNGNWNLNPQKGWMSNIDAEEAYGHLLRYATISAQDGIIGGTVFTTDGGHPWIESMDSEGFHTYWRQGPPQELGKAPAGTPQKPVERPTQPRPPQAPTQPTQPLQAATGVQHPRELVADFHGVQYPPVVGPLTEAFGENPQNYAQFGIPGHDGCDFGCPVGSPVTAFSDGVVAWCDEDVAYGNYIRIWHPTLRLHSFYGHLSEFKVNPGDTVASGQLIALSGNTGNTTGPHLHFEIRVADEEGNYMEGHHGYPKGRVDPETVVLVLQRVVA